jgi:hypothetical protein
MRAAFETDKDRAPTQRGDFKKSKLRAATNYYKKHTKSVDYKIFAATRF